MFVGCQQQLTTTERKRKEKKYGSKLCYPKMLFKEKTMQTLKDILKVNNYYKQYIGQNFVSTSNDLH